MEDTLVEVRSSSAKTIANKKDIAMQMDKLQAQATAWEAKVELAIAKERDDLAKAALQEKAKCVDAVSMLESELQLVDEQLTKLQVETGQLQEKLADAKARQKAIIMRQNTASSRLDVRKTLDSSKIDDAMHRFERYESKINDLEAQVEAYDLGKKTLNDEFAELASDDKINDELEALKKKIQNK